MEAQQGGGDDSKIPTEAPEEREEAHNAGYISDENLSAIDKQYAAQTGLPRRIHILGTGSIGKLVAHSLKGIANAPPITLILHRHKLLEAWENSKKVITIQDDGYDVERGGFDVELLPSVRRQHGATIEHGKASVYDVSNEDVPPHEAAKIMKEQQNISREEEGKKEFVPFYGKNDKNEQYHTDEPIHNLIVTTKAAVTVPAISAIKHRILPTSTICFLQNGMGTIDDVNSELFPNEDERPNYMQGIITHGANVPAEKAAQDPFYAVHAGHGTIALGLMPRAGTAIPSEKWAQSSRFLLRTLTRSPVLCAVGFTPTELLQLQLEKLAVNSIMNPLTSLIDNRNGALLYNFALTRTTRLMLAETSHVIRSLPELQSVPNVEHRFSPERLETLVTNMSHKTKDNISSMLADVRAGKKTEIEYINGYIVRRGEEIGIKCVVNYAIMQTVIGKAQMTQREERDQVPDDAQRQRALAE